METHILTIIVRSKGSQVTKFGQLIEHNKGSIFLEKSYTQYGGETISRPFSKKSKLSISTRSTLWKKFGVNKLSNIWISQFKITVHQTLRNFKFIKVSLVFVFALRLRPASSSFAHALNGLFLPCVCSKRFYTATLSHAFFNLLCNRSFT